MYFIKCFLLNLLYHYSFPCHNTFLMQDVVQTFSHKHIHFLLEFAQEIYKTRKQHVTSHIVITSLMESTIFLLPVSKLNKNLP